MTKNSKTQLHRQSIIDWIETQTEYKLDRFGHYKKTLSNGTEIRLKMAATSIRFERKIKFEKTQYSPARSEWYLISSDYIKNIAVTDDNKLRLGNYLIKPKVSDDI